ncbi:MAG: pyrroline-5-carboxylate reductase [Thiotrichales bacterium]|nr:pyrroline-5-carboxylate reductase [Thiotrichales bacterium]
MKDKSIVFIGCGNMGGSLIGGLLADGYDPALISAVEPDPERRAAAAEQFTIETFTDADATPLETDIIVLAVKPQGIAAVCRQLEQHLSGGTLIISIAAGIELASLSAWLGNERPIVRVMPNTPALIGAGASAMIANSHVNKDQKNQAEAILRSTGITLWLTQESLMNAVTAVSGSGPAYFFLIMEIMQKIAMQQGLAADQARLLTLQTALGAARMALESRTEVDLLRRQVTSPGGTTEAALQSLTAAGLESIFADALEAAARRSAELAKLYGDPGSV